MNCRNARDITSLLRCTFPAFQDLYVDRPLPYLIGSQAFMEQDDVGLGDLSSDGEMLIVFYPVACTL